ncbi:hypothetical protein C8R43DRAFT_943073 [Mycena crocata]|nr:hypothetical protein C8R43DRAFT_943073 [Mycena crocata]
MPKKKRVLRQLRRAHSPAPSTDRGAEIRERRRLEAADATNAGDVKTWVSDSWNEAMDGFMEPQASGSVLFFFFCMSDVGFSGAEELADTADGVSMDSGLSDESDCESDSDSLDATRIVCERSYARGDPLEAAWDALTLRLWPSYEMPAGVRHSLQIEHSFRPPRILETPKVQVFETLSTPSDFGAGGSCNKGQEGSAVECGTPDKLVLELRTSGEMFAPLDPTYVDKGFNSIAWFQVRQVVIITDLHRLLLGRFFELIAGVVDEDELREAVIKIV